MLILWILYATAVTTALAGAAWLAERVAAARRRPRRWVWSASIVLGLLLPVASWLLTEPPASGVGEAVVVPTPSAEDASPVPASRAAELASVAGRLLAPVDRVVTIGWPLASLALVLLGAGASLRLARARRRWRLRRVGGRTVLVSPATGPAVVGIVRPAIVLPEWATRAEPARLAWMLRHEVEHLRAHDARLVTVLAAAVILAPWNAALWWQLRRLRLAVELDCDARVLEGAGRTERRVYGRLLLEVGRRPAGPRLAPAFAERPSHLERRIRTMSDPSRPVSRARLVSLMGLLGLLLVAALTLPGPARAPAASEDGPVPADVETVVVPPEVEIEPPPAPELDDRAGLVEVDTDEWEPEPPPDVTDEPAFTPYDVPPTLANPREIQEVLTREYPPLLRDAGIGGHVDVLFFIDEEGRVRDARIADSSGHQALDEAALRVAAEMEFSAARNRDRTVPVWISFPITFQVR